MSYKAANGDILFIPIPHDVVGNGALVKFLGIISFDRNQVVVLKICD